MDDMANVVESAELLGNHHNSSSLSSCKICCLMCSCKNKKGFWYTKLGKFIFWFPIILILLAGGFITLDLLGIGTMKVLFREYDIKSGCQINIQNCTIPNMCYTDDLEALILGCAAIGSISFVCVAIGILLIMIFIGCIFYCFDSCCKEIDNSYRHSRFILQRSNNRNVNSVNNNVNDANDVNGV